MTQAYRPHAPVAAAFWAASLGTTWLDAAVHRTLVAAAITATVVAYIDRRASDRDVLIRLGLWTGAAAQRGRCTLMHDHDAERRQHAPRSPRGDTGTVDSEAWRPKGRDD